MSRPADSEPEGDAIPGALRVIDAHVHLFPPELFRAIWRWFDQNAWPIRYRLDPDDVIAFLRARGVARVVGLCYAHRPGLAAGLNAFMAEQMARHPELLGLGTVLPGEPDARGIVARALGEQGLRGIKIHCHVQGLAPDAPELDPVYEEAARAQRPVLIHAGSGPSLPGYARTPGEFCTPQAMQRALQRHPATRVIVPHLGADDLDSYARMLDAHPNLYLDTTMVLAGYFALRPDLSLLARYPDRILYGSDFPNIPYAWDRELRALHAASLPPAVLEPVLHDNALRLFGEAPTAPAQVQRG